MRDVISSCKVPRKCKIPSITNIVIDHEPCQGTWGFNDNHLKWLYAVACPGNSLCAFKNCIVPSALYGRVEKLDVWRRPDKIGVIEAARLHASVAASLTVNIHTCVRCLCLITKNMACSAVFGAGAVSSPGPQKLFILLTCVESWNKISRASPRSQFRS